MVSSYNETERKKGVLIHSFQLINGSNEHQKINSPFFRWGNKKTGLGKFFAYYFNILNYNELSV